MNKNRILNMLFDELENEGAIIHNKNKEYVKSSKYQQQMGNELFDYIRETISCKFIRDTLEKKVYDYVEACHDTYYAEQKTYYHRGFLDGVTFSHK